MGSVPKVTTRGSSVFPSYQTFLCSAKGKEEIVHKHLPKMLLGPLSSTGDHSIWKFLQSKINMSVEVQSQLFTFECVALVCYYLQEQLNRLVYEGKYLRCFCFCFHFYRIWSYIQRKWVIQWEEQVHSSYKSNLLHSRKSETRHKVSPIATHCRWVLSAEIITTRRYTMMSSSPA